MPPPWETRDEEGNLPPPLRLPKRPRAVNLEALVDQANARAYSSLNRSRHALELMKRDSPKHYEGRLKVFNGDEAAMMRATFSTAIRDQDEENFNPYIKQPASQADHTNAWQEYRAGERASWEASRAEERQRARESASAWQEYRSDERLSYEELLGFFTGSYAEASFIQSENDFRAWIIQQAVYYNTPVPEEILSGTTIAMAYWLYNAVINYNNTLISSIETTSQFSILDAFISSTQIPFRSPPSTLDIANFLSTISTATSFMSIGFAGAGFAALIIFPPAAAPLFATASTLSNIGLGTGVGAAGFHAVAGETGESAEEIVSAIISYSFPKVIKWGVFRAGFMEAIASQGNITNVADLVDEVGVGDPIFEVIGSVYAIIWTITTDE